MIKLLLISDLHLGLNNLALPISDTDRLATLSRAAEEATRCDMLLIAGGLFANPDSHLFAEANAILASLIEKGTAVIYTCTEAEQNAIESGQLKELSVTKLFTNGEELPFEFSKDGEALIIYGANPHSPAELINIAKRSDSLELGLISFDLDKHFPVESELKNLFKNLSLDFYALGGNHQVKLYRAGSRIIAAYPGTAEACDITETGDRYALSICIENNSICDVKRISINTTRIEQLYIDMESESNDPAKLISQNSGEFTALSVTLAGCRNEKIDLQELQSMEAGFKSLRITDDSYPSLELLYRLYCFENSLQGEFFRTLKKRDSAGEIDESMRKELAKMINTVMKNGSSISEEWLCALLNA